MSFAIPLTGQTFTEQPDPRRPNRRQRARAAERVSAAERARPVDSRAATTTTSSRRAWRCPAPAPGANRRPSLAERRHLRTVFDVVRGQSGFCGPGRRRELGSARPALHIQGRQPDSELHADVELVARERALGRLPAQHRGGLCADAGRSRRRHAQSHRLHARAIQPVDQSAQHHPERVVHRGHCESGGNYLRRAFPADGRRYVRDRQRHRVARTRRSHVQGGLLSGACPQRGREDGDVQRQLRVQRGFGEPVRRAPSVRERVAGIVPLLHRVVCSSRRRRNSRRGRVVRAGHLEARRASSRWTMDRASRGTRIGTRRTVPPRRSRWNATIRARLSSSISPCW